MSYDPVQYWTRRKNITPHDVPGRVKAYIRRHIKPYKKILDFGCGNGRLAPLLEGKDVTGYDIVKRDPPYPFTTELSGAYGAAICSKVLLHIPPETLPDIIRKLKAIADKVIVWDTSWGGAAHSFKHDYSEYCRMEDVQAWDKQLLFTFGPSA